MAVRCLLLPLALLALAASSAAVAQLEIGFYTKTCPDAEKIVRDEMAKIIAAAPSLAGPLFRFHFHDCFVRRVKAKLEAAYPGIVSCADMLTLMSCDAVVLTKGPFWPVALGRRDGRLSSATESSDELPPASSDVPLLAKIFVSKGLDLKDLVVLSGAHTLGTAHCLSFVDRLYNSTGESGAYGLVDPSLDSEYADKLRLKCKSFDDRAMLSGMDLGSFKTFDTSYYRHVAKRRGLFRSDAALLFDDTTRDYVQCIATGKFDGEFFKDFRASMIKMGDVGVLTGAEGEIRKKCYAPTSVR
uniref:Peroxidase n=1 Tax=Aegilops tauschii TaxID=37682 RepID=M8BRV8_AEGTA